MPPNSTQNPDEQTTFRCERWRAVSGGIIETAGSTFLLLIAVKHFEAGSVAKAVVAAGVNYGLLLTPLLVFLAASRGWRASRAAACVAALGSAAFLAAALYPYLPKPLDLSAFAGCGVAAMICASVFIPLLTQMYQDNYPEARRGRLFSSAVMIRISAAALFGCAAGEVLKRFPKDFQWLLLVFAAAMAAQSVCLYFCPSRPLTSEGHSHPFRGLAYVRDDALFRQTLLSWMLMGFANLMMVQMRVEYLANERYGKPLEANTIALLTVVIPNVARLVLSPVWGRLFDRMNFFSLRIALNIGFALGALAFFAGRDMITLAAGAIIFGMSNAGGEVAWSLWVTKLAPPDRVAEYMSVHTFFTGVRGVLAPIAAYYLLTHLEFQTLSMISAGIIVAASALLIPEALSARGKKPGTVLVEEVSE